MNEPTTDQQLLNAADRVFRTARSAAQQEVEQDAEGTKIHELLTHAHQLTDSVIREVVDTGPTSARPVCCEGCTACCHLHIVAFPVEVLALARRMRDQMSVEQIADIIHGLDIHIEQTVGLDASERRQIRIACPLLDSDRCAIYSYRPISCRGWNSLDRSICDADLANPAAMIAAPVNLRQYVLAGRVSEALGAASNSLHLDSRSLDFVRALRIALEDPIATAKAWRTGRDVFADAVNETVFKGPGSPEEEQARKSLWEQQ